MKPKVLFQILHSFLQSWDKSLSHAPQLPQESEMTKLANTVGQVQKGQEVLLTKKNTSTVTWTFLVVLIHIRKKQFRVAFHWVGVLAGRPHNARNQGTEKRNNYCDKTVIDCSGGGDCSNMSVGRWPLSSMNLAKSGIMFWTSSNRSPKILYCSECRCKR